MTQRPEHSVDPAALVDENLVRQAVARVNALVLREGLKATVRLGRYLRDTVLGGELAGLEGEGTPTWRALAAAPEFQVAPSTLWSAVKTVEQLGLLSREVGRALSVSHQREVVAVGDLAQKRALAASAVEAEPRRRLLRWRRDLRQTRASLHALLGRLGEAP